MKNKMLVLLSNDKVRNGLKLAGIALAVFGLAIGDSSVSLADTGPALPY
jgi:ABC-type transport system involved in cytochrome c biogenesis permease component